MEDLRSRLRAWLAANAPDPATLPPRSSPDYVAASQRFAKTMFDAGFSGLSWPVEVGGQGLGPAAQAIFSEEAGRYTLPLWVFGIGWGMCGPTLIDLGTPEQRRRFVRPMLEGSELWCQLFSEPAAGSDVAGLRTRAVRDGSGDSADFLVNGQKVWVTGAEFSDWGILLARTNPDLPKHRGLTMFIVDMRAPGVTVRPLRDMTGYAKFNEVFFDDVRIPADQVLGGVDEGWAAARVLLLHERLAVSAGLGTEGHTTGPLSFRGLVDTATRTGALPEAAREDLLDLYLLEQSIELFNNRISLEAAAGIDPGAKGSVGKLLKGRRDLQAASLAVRLLGPDTTPGAAADTHAAILTAPQLSIGGGTNEIQLSIIGERVLGLPREPQSDLKVPFRELRDVRPPEGKAS